MSDVGSSCKLNFFKTLPPRSDPYLVPSCRPSVLVDMATGRVLDDSALKRWEMAVRKFGRNYLVKEQQFYPQVFGPT